MKKDLLIIPTYIFVTLFLTAFLATFFVLYPMPSIGNLDYHIYALDVFVFSGLTLLPLVSVAALIAITLRAVKINTFTTLEFFTYIFLCVFVWLILIPFCMFFAPEKVVSMKITGNTSTIASVFFDPNSLPSLLDNLKMYALSIPTTLLGVFSDLLILRKTALNAGIAGRVDYLLFASLGVALSALYSLRFVSKWKLINVSTILFLWCCIIWINALMYKNEMTVFLPTKWTVASINGLITFVLLAIGVVTTAKQKEAKKEAI